MMHDDGGERSPNGLGPAEIEGILHAHRRALRLLVQILAELHPDPAALKARLDEHLAWRDHSEDPGAAPDGAYAIAGAADRELARILAGLEPDTPAAPAPGLRPRRPGA